MKYIGLTLIAFIIAEGLLQVISSPTLLMSKWYSSGIHTPDSTYGYAFSPNYQGWMRQEDNVFLEELTLDEYGFRTPAIRQDARKEIIIMGGKSMTFSYGVEQEDALHSQLQKHLINPSNVYCTSWPAVALYPNFKIYQRTLASSVKADLILVAIHGKQWDSYTREFISNIDSSHFSRRQLRELFFFDNQTVLTAPSRPIAKTTGALYYKSLLAHRISNKLDFAMLIAQSHLFSGNNIPEKGSEEVEIDKKEFTSFINSLNRYFSASNQKVIYIFLPAKGAQKNYYDNMITLLPNDITYFDVHKNLYNDLKNTSYIASIHYSRLQCQIIGAYLANQINLLNF